MTNPTSDEKLTTVDYKTRYGVYAVIPNADRSQIILVQVPNDFWLLPGREIEVGEDHFSALKREFIGELGFSAELGYYYGQADEYFYSRHRGTYFHNLAYIYKVTHLEEVDVPLGDFSNLSWFPTDETIEKLKRGSHKRGVEAWKKSHC